MWSTTWSTTALGLWSATALALWSATALGLWSTTALGLWSTAGYGRVENRGVQACGWANVHSRGQPPAGAQGRRPLHR